MPTQHPQYILPPGLEIITGKLSPNDKEAQSLSSEYAPIHSSPQVLDLQQL
jgi:hypothetical protein